MKNSQWSYSPTRSILLSRQKYTKTQATRFCLEIVHHELAFWCCGTHPLRRTQTILAPDGSLMKSESKPAPMVGKLPSTISLLMVAGFPATIDFGLDWVVCTCTIGVNPESSPRLANSWARTVWDSVRAEFRSSRLARCEWVLLV
jgi:hypothetical protein